MNGACVFCMYDGGWLLFRKQLTFLLQEMHRETNTIGSKTSDISISHEMIHLKEEIEKIREQVQNLE